MARPTVGLRDVARAAGVSPQTVSNLVNGYPHISPQTRAKVEGAIARLGYKPNMAARNLRLGRTGVIALAVPEIANPYFAELAKEVITAADENGIGVFIEQTGGDPNLERAVLKGIRSHLVDGVIFSPLGIDGAEINAMEKTTPLVLLGERAQDHHVAIDNVRAARDAVEHLIASGRRRIAAIGAQHEERSATARLRLSGYHEALATHGITPETGLIVNADPWDREEGAAAVQRLLDSDARPEALFCFSDLLAIGVLARLRQLGLSVPDDLAVIGIDGISEGEFSAPPLTTIAPDKQSIASRAVRLILRRINDPEATPPGDQFVEHRLVRRQST